MADIAPEIPSIPDEAVEFAKEVGDLADRYGLRDIEMIVRIDTGIYGKYRERSKEERLAETMTIRVSKKDGRGRPRTQIEIKADITVRVPVVWEPNSSN